MFYQRGRVEVQRRRRGHRRLCCPCVAMLDLVCRSLSVITVLPNSLKPLFLFNTTRNGPTCKRAYIATDGGVVDSTRCNTGRLTRQRLGGRSVHRERSTVQNIQERAPITRVTRTGRVYRHSVSRVFPAPPNVSPGGDKRIEALRSKCVRGGSGWWRRCRCLCLRRRLMSQKLQWRASRPL
jgi:hypothetical protein